MILEATHHQDPSWFGKVLRGQREASGVSLDAICEETKISRRILESLESGTFEYLPEKVFCRSFVTQVATAIGCDATPLLADFDSAWEEFELESGEFALLQIPEPPPTSPIRWSFWFPMGVGALILTSAAVVILSGSEPGQETLVETARPQAVASFPSVTPTGIARVPSVVAESIGAEGREAEDVVTLGIRVDGENECWIHYRDREGHTDQRLLAGGTSVQLELDGPVKLTIGNAGAATLSVGGIEYTGLGIPGQVVHTEVSRDGVRTLGSQDRHD